MISYLINYKYHIISIIIVIIIGYVAKNYKKDTVEVKDKIDEVKIKENELEKLIKSFENSIKKSTQTLIKFNQNNSLKTNYLNMRNELFTKDTLKTKILIDSHDKTDSSPSNSDYTIKLSDLADTFKNVIGFRMIECSIPITGYNINENNNIITIEIQVIDPALASSDFENRTLNIEFPAGNYTAVEVGNIIATEIRNILIPLILPGKNISDATGLTVDGKNTYELDPSNQNNRIFDIRFNEETENYEFFVWNFDNVTLSINQGANSNLFYRLLGTNRDETIIFQKRYDNPQPERIIHQNYSFLDIVVDDIPSIACKMNTSGKNIIDRVFVNVDRGTILNYRVPESETQTNNYFYPISLDNISIKIFAPDGNLYDPIRTGDNYFEFEITTLVNTKLMN